MKLNQTLVAMALVICTLLRSSDDAFSQAIGSKLKLHVTCSSDLGQVDATLQLPRNAQGTFDVSRLLIQKTPQARYTLTMEAVGDEDVNISIRSAQIHLTPSAGPTIKGGMIAATATVNVPRYSDFALVFGGGGVIDSGYCILTPIGYN